MRKDRAAVVFRRSASGEVTGEIVDEAGAVRERRSFGVMTEGEFRRILGLLEETEPDLAGMEIMEILGN